MCKKAIGMVEGFFFPTTYELRSYGGCFCCMRLLLSLRKTPFELHYCEAVFEVGIGCFVPNPRNEISKRDELVSFRCDETQCSFGAVTVGIC